MNSQAALSHGDHALGATVGESFDLDSFIIAVTGSGKGAIGGTAASGIVTAKTGQENLLTRVSPMIAWFAN